MSQVCVVTGSSRGIGLAIAKQLADDGHQVVLNSRSPLKPEVLEQFADAKLEVGTIVGDVSDFADAERMITAVKEQYGRIDVLVNNAGITRDGLVMRMKEEDFDQVIATNLKGVSTWLVTPHQSCSNSVAERLLTYPVSQVLWGMQVK